MVRSAVDLVPVSSRVSYRALAILCDCEQGGLYCLIGFTLVSVNVRKITRSVFSFFKTEYDCEDATCISADLRCNGVKNCKFGWDEESCGDISGEFMKLFAKTHVVSILVVLTFIMVGMIAGT